MKNFITLLYSTVLAFLLVSESTVAQTQAPTSIEWETHKTEYYSISHPGDWDLDTSGIMNSQFILFSQLTSDQDSFKENLSFITQNLGTNDLNLEDYIEATKQQVTTLLVDGQIISSIKIDTLDETFYHLKYVGQQGVFNLVFDQYIWVNNNLATLLTFTAEKDSYDTYLPIATKIMNSFKIEKKFEEEKAAYTVEHLNEMQIVSTENYEITLPANWTLGNETMGIDIMAIKVDTTENSISNESFNVITEDLQGIDISLSKYTELSLTNLSKIINDYKLISSNSIKRGEINFQEVIITGRTGDMPLTFCQTYLLDQNKAYIITYTGNEILFKSQREQRQEILSSFNLKQK